MAAQQPPSRTGIAPLSFAIGIVVLLVGLIVNPLVIAPLGGAITLLATVAWILSGERTARPIDEAPLPPATAETEERYSRSRLLERSTLALGGLIGLGVALPAVGFTVLPSFLGQRQRPVDLGPTSTFPEGQFVIATFLADPQAGEVSRRSAYVRSNGFVGNEPSFTIMSSRCTHVGCPTKPNGLIFTRNGHLWLERRYSVSRVNGTGAQVRIHAFALKGAGEPATGPESWFYPLDPS